MAAWPDNARHLTQALSRSAKLRAPKPTVAAANDRPDSGVRGRRPAEWNVHSSGPAAGSLGARAVEHPLREVDAHHLATRRDSAGKLEREIAGTGCDVEHAVAGADGRELGARARHL